MVGTTAEISLAESIINLICQKLGIVANWTGENVVPYIQMLLAEVATGRFYLHKTLAFIFGAVFLLGLAFIAVGIIQQRSSKVSWTDDDAWKIAGVVFVIIGITGCAAAICLAVCWNKMPTTMSYRWLLNMIRNNG